LATHSNKLLLARTQDAKSFYRKQGAEAPSEATMKSSTLLVLLCLQAALVMGIFAAVAKENGMRR